MNTLRNLKQKGLSLMELIVVLIIAGILAAVGVAKYQDISSGASDTVTTSNGQAVASAINAHLGNKANYGKYPTISDLAGKISIPGGSAEAVVGGKIKITDAGGKITNVNLLVDSADTCANPAAATATTATTEYACGVAAASTGS